MTTPPPATFLHLILEGCAITEKHELKALLAKLGGEISDLKVRVKEVIEDRYVNFTKLSQKRNDLLDKAHTLKLEIEELELKVKTSTSSPSLRKSTSELSSSLKEVREMSTFVNELLDIDNTFHSIDRLQEKKDYCEIARAFTHLRDVLFEEPNNKINNLDIYQALANEYSQQCSGFMDDMHTMWSECIKLENKPPEDSDQSLVCTWQIDLTRSKEISQLFLALNYLEPETLFFKRFAEKIWKSILLPIILHGACVETDEPSGETALLALVVKPSSENEKLSHMTVFKNLLKVFQFVNSHLGFHIDNYQTLLNKVGSVIGEDFCNLMIEHCLSSTIPSHTSQLDAYMTVITETSDFQKQLIEIGFLSKDNQTLVDYVGSVEQLCANKKCQFILEKAREIVKKDLHDMVEVGGQTDVAENEEDTIKTENISLIIKPEINLSKNTFRFPKCKISKSALELLHLINDVLLECAASGECAVRLFYTARNVVELYCAVVPAHHQKFLKTFPQHVALFHNNCMYLSHCLMTVGDSHRSLLPQVLQHHLLTFVDQVTELRTIGTTVFLKHMDSQRDQLLEIIRGCALARLNTSPNLTSGTEKALRQCMRQLELLQTIWQPILPANVYSKAIGCLVNAYTDELIRHVVTAEDIPIETATQLVEMFKLVSNRVPKVFHEPSEIHRHVKKWEMFLELTLILGANLREISDRWANGKGPTARLFQPEQVKQLVRALFQNTERRSAFLLGMK